MISGNRGLNDSKIKKIIKEIEGGNDMLRYYPIQVKAIGNRLEILDGQHRYFICTKLQRPVYYLIVSEQKTMPDIARVNSNVEKWTQQNFINCHVNHNNKNYIILQSFIDAYKINVGTSLNLLANGHPGVEGHNGTLKNLFETGEFEVKFYDEAISIASDCKRFESFHGWRDRSFVIAIHRIRKAGKISIADLAEQFNKYPDILQKQHSQKDYIYNLEQIVNHKKQNRIVII